MATFHAQFRQLAGRKVPHMTVRAESLDGFSVQLEHRVAPLLGSRPITISARRDGTLTVTNHVGARVGTGRWVRES